MVDLTENSAFGDALPVTFGALQLAEVDLGPVYSIAPFKGQGAQVDQILSSMGLGFPSPGQTFETGDMRIIWSGRDQAFLIGVAPDEALGTHAAVTDQGDAWCAARLSGEGAEEVLARLVPLDLRVNSFAVGCTVRTQLGHMNVSLTRDQSGFLIMAFRSMARDLAHEVGQVMRLVAARGLAG